MVKTIINEEVILSYPDGFEEMEGRSSRKRFLTIIRTDGGSRTRRDT